MPHLANAVPTMTLALSPEDGPVFLHMGCEASKECRVFELCRRAVRAREILLNFFFFFFQKFVQRQQLSSMFPWLYPDLSVNLGGILKNGYRGGRLR